MRGAAACSESLFTTVKLEDFVPANHPLRPIRAWVNEALARKDAKSLAMDEADIKGGRPSIAREQRMRAMLLPVLYSVRSERKLVVEQRSNATCCSAGSSAWPSRTASGIREPVHDGEAGGLRAGQGHDAEGRFHGEKFLE